VKVRKKPVVIEAERFHSRNNALPFSGRGDPVQYHDGHFFVVTLSGPVTLRDGDWVLRGVAGEFYPCDPEIFSATYEGVDD
jgi:hypothetical protein